MSYNYNLPPSMMVPSYPGNMMTPACPNPMLTQIGQEIDVSNAQIKIPGKFATNVGSALAPGLNDENYAKNIAELQKQNYLLAQALNIPVTDPTLIAENRKAYLNASSDKLSQTV